MNPLKPTDVAARVRDGDRLDQAILAARRRVLRLHRQMGVPLVVRQGEQMVELAPETVRLPDDRPAEAPVKRTG